MPVIHGPNNRWHGPPDGAPDLAFRCACETLGEAINAYERAFCVSITPYDGINPPVSPEADAGPKYFVYSDAPLGEEPDEILVDIHVERNGEEICPKQDLAFRLQPDDVVQIWTGMVC